MIRLDVADGLDLTVKRAKAYGRILASSKDMMETYRPTGSVSKWDCFRASPELHWNVSDEEWRTVRLGAWSRFCRSEVQYYDLDGDHSSCIRKPYIDSLQRQINRALAARGI